MLNVCLDNQETFQLLYNAADEFARGDVPRGVGHCFTLATMTLTVLQKKDGGVRGITTGTTFRRLVAKTNSASKSKQRVLHSSSHCHSGRSRLRGARSTRPRETLMRHSSPSRGGRAPSPFAVCQVHLFPAFRIRGANRRTLSCPFFSASQFTTH